MHIWFIDIDGTKQLIVVVIGLRDEVSHCSLRFGVSWNYNEKSISKPKTNLCKFRINIFSHFLSGKLFAPQFLHARSSFIGQSLTKYSLLQRLHLKNICPAGRPRLPGESFCSIFLIKRKFKKIIFISTSKNGWVKTKIMRIFIWCQLVHLRIWKKFQRICNFSKDKFFHKIARNTLLLQNKCSRLQCHVMNIVFLDLEILVFKLKGIGDVIEFIYATVNGKKAYSLEKIHENLLFS